MVTNKSLLLFFILLTIEEEDVQGYSLVGRMLGLACYPCLTPYCSKGFFPQSQLSIPLPFGQPHSVFSHSNSKADLVWAVFLHTDVNEWGLYGHYKTKSKTELKDCTETSES